MAYFVFFSQELRKISYSHDEEAKNGAVSMLMLGIVAAFFGIGGLRCVSLGEDGNPWGIGCGGGWRGLR